MIWQMFYMKNNLTDPTFLQYNLECRLAIDINQSTLTVWGSSTL